MLVTKNSRGTCTEKCLIEASNRMSTIVEELLLHVSNSNRRFLHSIPHSMVDLAQATLEQDCVFMSFRKVIKDTAHCVLTNELNLELDEETLIRNHVIEKLQESAIIKKLFNECQPTTRRQK